MKQRGESQDRRLTSLPFDTSELTPVDTPVDSKGIVLVERTMDIVKSVYPNGIPLRMPGEVVSIHEFYWKEATFRRSRVAEKFRILPPNRGRLPRGFHSILHLATLPPMVPREEVMEEYNENWDIAHSLFTAAAMSRKHRSMKAKRLKQLARHSEHYKVSQDVINETLEYFTRKEQESLRYFGRVASRVAGLHSLSHGFNFQGLAHASPDDVVANIGIFSNNGARSMRPLLAV